MYVPSRLAVANAVQIEKREKIDKKNRIVIFRDRRDIMNLFAVNGHQLACNFYKGRREMAESGVHAESERSETFEKQRKNVRRHIKIFRGRFFPL